MVIKTMEIHEFQRNINHVLGHVRLGAKMKS